MSYQNTPSLPPQPHQQRPPHPQYHPQGAQAHPRPPMGGALPPRPPQAPSPATRSTMPSTQQQRPSFRPVAPHSQQGISPSPLPQRPHTPAGLAHSQPHQQPLPHQLYQQPHPQRPVPLSATAPAGNPNPAGANGLVSQMGQMGIHDQAAPHKPRPRRVYPTDPGAHPGGSASPVRPVTPQSGPHQQQQQHPSYQPQALTPGYSPATAMHGQQLSSARYPQQQQQQQQPLPPPQQAQSQLFTPAAATTAFGQAPPPPYPRAAPHPQHSQQPSAVPAEPPKPRINPDQMPSPVAVHAHDQEMFSTEPYVTSQKTNVPMVSTRYRTIDEGNCNPRFMRMSAYNVPVSEGLQNTAKIPIGLLVQPLARLEPGEEPIQVVDFSEEGPIRCARCKSYINPYYTFVNGGKSFVCNICRHENDVPSDYFCNLDMSGRRLDWETRPELRHGSIEFLATKDFISRPPVPASYVFAIDVSWQSIQSRMLEACVTAIKDILYGGEGLPPLTKFGLITYDRHVHFYNLSSSLEQAQMLTVPDIDDVFVPLHDGLCVDPYESREVIEDLLDRLPGLFASNRTAEASLGAIVPAIYEALRGKGGRVFIFQTNRPTFGPGLLDDRNYSKLLNTENERKLYSYQSNYYHKWGEKYVDEGICASMYLFPNAFADVASSSELCKLTGGEVMVYPNFTMDRDGAKFAADLEASATQTFGTNGVLRIRCSDGIRVDQHLGNFFMRNHVDIELAGIMSSTSICATFKHDEKLDEKLDAYFQVALLYTTSDGHRRIRVHNIALPCTTLVGNLFRHAEIDTTMNIIARQAMSQAKGLALKEVRKELSEECVRILLAYRTNCASGSSPSQLILPEAYKLMPLYTLSLLKSMALRESTDVNIDLRVQCMYMLSSMSVEDSVTYFYPRIVPLHDVKSDEGVADEEGIAKLPAMVRASYSRLDPSGVYAIESRKRLYIWVGAKASAALIGDLFGTASVNEVDPQMAMLPEHSTDINAKAQAILRTLQHPRRTKPVITLARQGLDRAEGQIASLLVEDQNNSGLSYSDYLCFAHRQIQNELHSKR